MACSYHTLNFTNLNLNMIDLILFKVSYTSNGFPQVFSRDVKPDDCYHSDCISFSKLN